MFSKLRNLECFSDNFFFFFWSNKKNILMVLGVNFKGYLVVAELSCDKSSFRSGMFGEGF